MPSRLVPGQTPKMLSALGDPPRPCLVGSSLVQPPLRILGAQAGPGVVALLCASILYCAPSRPGLGLQGSRAPTPPTLQGPVRPIPLTSTKLGGPRSWKLRKTPGAQGPTASGGLQGADPLLIYATPPCSLCPKLLSSHLSQGPGIPAELVAGPLVSICIYN